MKAKGAEQCELAVEAADLCGCTKYLLWVIFSNKGRGLLRAINLFAEPFESSGSLGIFLTET